ncbi:uncharacterized protein LOC144110413 [Amblyomma americanum]
MKASMILIWLVLSMLLAGLIYFVLFSGPFDTEPTEQEAGSGGGGSGGGGGGGDHSSDSQSEKYRPPPAPPISPTPATSTVTYTTSTETSSTTTVASTSTVTTPMTMATPPLNTTWVRLVCTFGMSGVDISMVPPDGLCDYIFYTDVHYNVEQQKIMPTHGYMAFDVLKEAANSYTSTTMGTSMELGTIGGIVANDSSKVKAAMEDLFRQKFVHFGMLNIDKTDVDFNTIKTGDLRYLSLVHEVLRAKTSPPEYHCAVGMGVTTKHEAQALADGPLEAIRLFPRISIVILKIHIGKVYFLNDTYPAPPNPDYDILTEFNFMTLNTTEPILSSLNDITAGGRFLLLSLAMYARASRMRNDFNGRTILPANRTTFFDYAAACTCRNAAICRSKIYPRDRATKSTILQIWGNHTLVMFENSTQIAEKARRRMALLSPKRMTGVAAYNVEMDDTNGVCGTAFKRLQGIKDKVLQFRIP